MSSGLEIIDTPTRRRTAKGVVYEAKFYWVGTDPESVMPAIGSPVSWISTTKPSRVVEARSDPLGCAAHMIYVSATTESDDGDITDPKTKDDFAKSIQKRMTLKEMHLDPKWWGMRKADSTDSGATPYNKFKKKNSDIEYSLCYWYPRTDSTVETKIRAQEGDYIFKNAVPQLWAKWTDTSKSPGDADYDGDEYQKFLNKDMAVGGTDTTLSPYVGPADTNVQYANFPCKTFVYSVTFYSRKKFNQIGMFAGLSGTFGKGCEPFDTATRRWKALDQQTENVTDADGDIWSKITRSMELAPSTWTWVLAKSVHGTWKW